MKTVLRTFRTSPGIDKILQGLAKYEDRTVSKVIQRIIDKAVIDYADKTPGFWETYNNDVDYLIFHGVSQDDINDMKGYSTT